MARSFKPGGFTFEPRTIARNPKQFGRSTVSLHPTEDVDPSSPIYLAANLQHRVANAIRERLLADGEDTGSFIRGLTPPPPGMTYDRVVRILRGETLMQLADLAAWSYYVPSVATVITESFEPFKKAQGPTSTT